jgi:hypothetical protein
MNLKNPEEILTQVTQMQLAQQPNQRNRTRINTLFNGEAPMSEEECREENIRTNANWLSATRVASNATNQLNAAFFKGDRFFSIRVDKGPARLRPQVSAILTKVINRELKRSRAYRAARESAHAQVVLHGPGPLIWRNSKTPVPSTAGIEDVLIPAGTLCDMSNLDRFAFYRELTWPQLKEAAFGDVVDPGWNKDYTKALLATLYKEGMQPIYQGNRWLFPEKLAEDFKEGANWSASSALPRVLAWDFFFLNEKTNKWNRRMVLDYASMAAKGGLKDSDAVFKTRDVLYSKDDYCEDWQSIIHWYIGNCSNVAPYRYHSIRSIGFLLYGSCLVLNKLMNRNFDHMFQQLLTWFRNVSDDNREKLGLIDLQNFGVLPDGVSLVTASERYLVDPRYIQMGIDQATQMIAQSAMSFVPDMEGASKDKMMTATETLVRQNQSITLTNAVLGQLGDQSLYEYREICRRFCIKSNPDPMAEALRKEMREQGISLDYLDVDTWDVIPEMSVGSGNKASELLTTQALLQEVFPLVDAEGKRLILRKRYAALTDNPDEAITVVPEVPRVGGPDEQQAQLAFTVLMARQQFVQPEGVNHEVMAGMLMGMAAQALQQVEAMAQTPDGLGLAAMEIAGVANVLGHVQNEIGAVMQSEAQKEVAKMLEKQFAQLSGELTRLSGEVQKLMEEQAQAQPSGDQAKLMAKLQEIQMSAEVQRQIAGANAAQKMEQKQISWMQENERRNADTAAEIGRTDARTAAELRASLIKADADSKIAVMKEAKKPAPKAPAAK